MSAPSSHQPGTDRVTEPKQPDRTLGELFGELGSELGALVRSELELAKTETRQEVRRAGRAGAAFGTAAVAGLLTLLFLSYTLAWLLDQWINRALSFLIVAVLWAIVAMIGVRAGRARARAIEPVPQTVNTLKEDVEWIRQQKG
jgi:uncharacterized membrane protein YqjE